MGDGFRRVVLGALFERPNDVGDFLMTSAQVLRYQGELEKALDAAQESVRLMDPGSARATLRADHDDCRGSRLSGPQGSSRRLQGI